MFRTISSLLAIFAFAATASAVTPANALLGHGEREPDVGLDLGLGLGLDLGECFAVDAALGGACKVVVDVDVDADIYCNPLTVEAACIAVVGIDSSVHAFSECVAEMTAHCESEIEAGGALFCEGVFVGAGTCLLGQLAVDGDEDTELSGSPGLDLAIGLDLGPCFDVGASLECAVLKGPDCVAGCTPLSVEAACVTELGEDAGLHAFAACQAELISQCDAACTFDGALFCGDDIYAGGELCL